MARKKNSQSAEDASVDATRDFIKEVIDVRNLWFELGYVTSMVDMALEMLERRYHHCSTAEAVRPHISWCLSPERHSTMFGDMEYEIWCMMAMIAGVE